MLYVAYGSNMNLDQMEYRCPNSKIIGNGIIYNYKLVFNIHADIIKSENAKTPVVVWDISDEDWPMLDIYEGYPEYYIRKNISVKLDEGENKTAVVYVMNDKHKGICPPTTRYFQSIVDGCVNNNIDTQYLFDAFKYACENETEYNQYVRQYDRFKKNKDTIKLCLPALF